MNESEQQKISWKNYKSELELMCTRTRNMKKDLLLLARKSNRWNLILGYSSKILVGITASGGGIQIFNNLDDPCNNNWLTIVTTVITIIIGILITTKDAFNFEKQTEKYYTAENSINAFYEMLKFQSFQIKGTEGDRLEILKGLKNMYNEIVQNNTIIQTVEHVSESNTPEFISSDIPSPDILYVENPDEIRRVSIKEEIIEDPNTVIKKIKFKKGRRESEIAEDNTRMVHIHKLLNDIDRMH